MGIRTFFARSTKKQDQPSPLPIEAIIGTPVIDASSARQSLEPHTLSTFDTALNELDARVANMGDSVAQMVDDCALIFLDHEIGRAKDLIRSDLEIDAHKDGLIVRTIDILVRHQPVASDLRLVLAIEHVASDLERTADHAKNIAKRALSVPGGTGVDPTIRDLILSLHKAVSAMLRDSLTAFRKSDAQLATEVSQRDQVPDALYDDLFHAVISRIQTDPANAIADVQALFVGKSLERIGDHATNIAGEARFLARGDIPSATRAT